ncbi:MAG: shikimate dehydrogenase [Candidatus Eremiobacteraeota bacterium]|nr:shikimate dehydrogenase [Candidatus Eremiobacteraeota bacterium]
MLRFGFFVHPIDMHDVARVAPQAANKRQALVEKILEWTPPHEVAHVKGLVSADGKDVEGWFIAVPLFPHQFMNMPKEFVYEKLRKGAQIARDKGVQILGLGGFTSIIGNGGIAMAEMVPDIPVTSGNSYTIATAVEATVEAAKRLGIDLSNATATVIGASGSIGSCCAHLLAPQVKKMVLVARNLKRLEKIAEGIRQSTGRETSVFSDVSVGINKADIVVSATSSSGDIIKAHDLKSGALVCDVSLPHDVCREVAFLRPDVLVIEGGLVEIPQNVRLNYDFGYPDNVSLACMAETMALCMEERFEVFSIGRGIKIENVREITRITKRQGFKLAGFRSFDQLVTDKMIERVKKLKSQNVADYLRSAIDDGSGGKSPIESKVP